jgi:D-alanyl-D-alanine carboxypeptidase/D-alanyl-D-alanine-endopeptidase (penicillin-binding protein 4)
MIRKGLATSLALTASLIAAPRPRPRLSASERILARRLGAELAGPTYRRGFFGVYVYSLDRHVVVFSHNGEQWFTPASNAKLFTLAAALTLLGPDYRIHTALLSTAAPDAHGVIDGDVILKGVGDPSLSGRPYPYRPDPPAPQLPFDPGRVPRALARQLAARGITRITGSIIGDDSYFTPAPYPPGWAIGDEMWDYGAPVSALTLNDNTRFLQIFPAAVGEAPRLVWSPAVGAPRLSNRAATTAPGTDTRLRLRTLPFRGGLALTGTIAADNRGDLEALAVYRPALFAAKLLRQALIAQGIAVEGTARARHRAGAAPATLYPLGGWQSPPLAEIIQATAKESQNLEAELMLRQLGKLRGSAPTTAGGEAVVQQFLRNAGLAPSDDAQTDGSGLSRQDLVTPAGVVRLLDYMARSPQAAAWRALFPIAGRDGTLQHRFRGEFAAGRLRAKTGSLSHVNSLSGYVTARNGERLAFSLLSNNVLLPNAEVRHRLDELAETLAAW